MTADLTAKKLESTLKFLDNISLIMGVVHGGISVILQSPEDEIRDKLTDLFHKLSKDIQELYYPQLEDDVMQ